MQSFLEKLIDWKGFEKFVAELYADSDEVIVEHNVTEQGKSTAKRQIDVLVTQKAKLHTIKTVIECKLWKKPVDRQVIDVLSATVEDLNANKGAIFTTKGYEQGAITLNTRISTSLLYETYTKMNGANLVDIFHSICKLFIRKLRMFQLAI